MHRVAALRRSMSGRRGLQATAAAIAVCLAVPLVVSGSLAQNMGYAFFGYEPAQCGQRTDRVQTINGDKVRVCQHVNATATTFVPGDVNRAESLFYLGLPGQGNEPNEGLEFSCCASGENASGRYVKFVDNAFGPVTGSDPLSGTTTMTAAYAGHTYATVSQTSTVPRGVSSYVTTYAVTNVSGGPLPVRPFVEVYGFGGFLTVRTFAADMVAGTYKIDTPVLGGSVTLASSTASGSPAIAHFQAGSGQSLGIRPGHDLDDTVHAPDGYERMSGSALAIQWADHTSVPLANGATAHYTVRTTIQQPRSLHLALHDPAAPPFAGAPTLIDAETRGFTPSAGTPLAWRTYGGGAAAQNFSGTLGLDGAGRATVTVPAFTGSRTFTAYVDRNGNGRQDADEPDRYASLWIPPAAGGPPVPGGPIAAPVPPAKPSPPTIAHAAARRPSVSGPSKVKASRLRKGIVLTLSHLNPRSRVTLKALLKKQVVKTVRGKATARGTVKLKLKVTARVARRLRGKTLSLRFSVVTATGTHATITRRLRVS